eukprot:15442123-Alexandrium_andersonii.AAC.1
MAPSRDSPMIRDLRLQSRLQSRLPMFLRMQVAQNPKRNSNNCERGAAIIIACGCDCSCACERPRALQ